MARTKLTARRPTSTATAKAASKAAIALAVGESRLAVNLPIATHRDLKVRAARDGRSIKDYLLDILRKAGIDVP